LIICLGLTLILIIPTSPVFRSRSQGVEPNPNLLFASSSNEKGNRGRERELEARESKTHGVNFSEESSVGREVPRLPTLTPRGPLADTRDGLVYGSVKNVAGREVNIFLGIPYAVPPLNNLRFKKPVKGKPWASQGIDAKNFSSPCIQFVPENIPYTPWVSKRKGSEDCLYLNIWTPSDPKKQSNTKAEATNNNAVGNSVAEENTEGKTVMIWFHGGAFFSGSADLDLYDGEVLAALGDVIVVSVNYRLGALGFLTTTHDSIGGNMGMYDQVLAINWVKDNIFAFGGDSDNIVLFGQSAGATSAGLHLFSPLTRDISSRVILQSGGPLFPKIYFENQLEKGNVFLDEVGCYSSPSANSTDSLPEEVIDCLTTLPVDTIVQGHSKLFQKYKIPFFPHAGDDFLPDLPHEMIHEWAGSQTEILMGNNEDEGSFFLHIFFPELFPNHDIAHINLSLNDATSYITKAYSFIPESQAQLMSQFFLAGSSLSNKTKLLKTTYDIIGDSGFVCPAVVLSEVFSEFNVSVYHYLMKGRPESSNWNPWMGSTHLDEVQFVFGLPLRQDSWTKYTDNERDFSRRIIDSWTTFAKTGRMPQQLFGIEWPLYTKDNPSFLEMNTTSVRVVKASPHKLSCNVWKIIYDSFL
jgi:carboxylesterase type B